MVLLGHNHSHSYLWVVDTRSLEAALSAFQVAEVHQLLKVLDCVVASCRSTLEEVLPWDHEVEQMVGRSG